MRNSLKHVVLLNSGISYLLRDDFTDTVAAGSVDGTAATPGPGTRLVTDPSNHISVASGNMEWNGSDGLTTEHVNYLVGSRTAGLTTIFSHLVYPNGAFINGIGTSNSASANQAYAYSSILGRIVGRGVGPEVILTPDNYITGAHTIALAMRDSGWQTFANNGGGWDLLWVGDTGVSPTLYSVQYATSTNAKVGFARSVNAGFLATPLASDGAFGATTDGQGHAETSGIGAGGSGLAWTDNKGTWSGGSATALSGGEAIRTVDVSNADVFVDLDITHTAGNASIMLRYTDDDNYLRCGTDGMNAVLAEKVSGTENTLSTTAITYGAADTMRIRLEGQAARIYYDNAFVSATSSIDASLTGTKVGLYTTDTGNSFDNLVAYASTGYTFLNQFVS